MSPASRSKSKDKKAGKEAAKVSSKPSVHVNTSGGIPASGYNPLLGTFHTFESGPLPTASPVPVNGRFRNIVDPDDLNGNSTGTGIEYDSVSNNGSWSGESEDHKDKTSQPTPRHDSIPGADGDKREKIRQKNERKHQRQKERRAQELHERCSGYLMSRKLESLAQQLVAMGFSQERATMALIMNEGRVEESVAWLFEGAEEDKSMEHNLDSGGNLKIDISEELARIADMEIRYKASKQEVERAVVSCEGDLEKAEQSLKEQKQEPPATPPKPEENFDPPKVSVNALNQNAIRVQPKFAPSISVQQRRDDRDFNYTKAPVTNVGSLVDTGTKSMQALKKVPPKLDLAKPQQIRASPSVSYSSTSPVQASTAPSTKPEPRFNSVTSELKNLQLGSVREPVILMQRPQSINMKQVPSSSISSSPPGTGWYPNNGETLKSNGFVPPVTASRSFSHAELSSNAYHQHYQSQQFVSSNSATGGNGLWSRGGSSPPLAAASLGLFSGMGPGGPSGSSSSVDWSMGNSTGQFDYANIDWSLDLASLSSKSGLSWNSTNYSMQNNGRPYDSFAYGLGVKAGLPKVNVASMSGLQDGLAASEGGTREWTSPFEEKDLFSLPRQYVTSPSL